jgi:type II secretory pathway pseudopilin PulG
MNIESFSGAATVATASTIVFALAMKSWHYIARRASNGPRFATAINREAAQRFRDELEQLTASQWTCLSAALVFVVLFVSAHALHAERIYAGYPDWQLYIVIGLLAVLAGLVARRLVLDIRSRAHLELLRDANLAIGHHLQHIAAGFGRVYHDVETTAGIIDHLVIGTNGVYAVNVFAEDPVANGRVVLDTNTLRFEPIGNTQSIVAAGKRIAALEREFRRLLDHRVRVRSVIAVPGWEVHEQAGDEHLVVNDRSLPMLRGWKDQADFLMGEDLESLQELLGRATRP